MHVFPQMASLTGEKGEAGAPDLGFGTHVRSAAHMEKTLHTIMKVVRAFVPSELQSALGNSSLD